MRYQIEDRKLFTYQEKKKILAKSEGKCAHCGKPLKESEDMWTVEHIIPISKGGSNDKNNLVMLCKTCNENKSNNIIDPEVYYKYIKKDCLNGILERYNYYKKDVFWFQRNTYFSEDAFEIKIPYGSKKGSPMVTIGACKKVTFEDYDKICDFIFKYNEKYGLSSKGLRDKIDRIVKTGAAYMIYGKAGITAVIPMLIELGDLCVGNMGNHREEPKRNYYINIPEIYCLYPKELYAKEIIYVLEKFIKGMCEASSYNEMVVKIDCLKEDAFANSLMGYGYMNADYNRVEGSPYGAIYRSYMFYKTINASGEIEQIKGISDEKKRVKTVERFSKFLQRSLNLKKFDNKKGAQREDVLKGRKYKKRLG